jgi:hypothetical protein
MQDVFAARRPVGHLLSAYCIFFSLSLSLSLAHILDDDDDDDDDDAE